MSYGNAKRFKTDGAHEEKRPFPIYFYHCQQCAKRFRFTIINRMINLSFDAATETDYWLELLQKAGMLTVSQAESMRQDCAKLQAQLRAVI